MEMEDNHALLLGASKGFERGCYSELFNILLDKKVCPRILAKKLRIAFNPTK